MRLSERSGPSSTRRSRRRLPWWRSSRGRAPDRSRNAFCASWTARTSRAFTTGSRRTPTTWAASSSTSGGSSVLAALQGRPRIPRRWIEACHSGIPTGIGGARWRWDATRRSCRPGRLVRWEEDDVAVGILDHGCVLAPRSGWWHAAGMASGDEVRPTLVDDCILTHIELEQLLVPPSRTGEALGRRHAGGSARSSHLGHDHDQVARRQYPCGTPRLGAVKAMGSVAIGLSQRRWSSIGVMDDVERQRGPPPLPRSELRHGQPAKSSWRAGPAAVGGVPVFESCSVGGIDVEHLGRVQAVVHRRFQTAVAHVVQPVEVLSGAGEPQVPGVGLVENDGGELGVVGPRTPAEVVRAGAGPDVIDDADLGVDVDRHAGGVLQAVCRDTLGMSVHQAADRAPPTELLRHTVETTEVWHQRDDDDQAKVRPRPQLLLEDPRDIVAPEVLVLDVDEALRPPHCLAVTAGDAALAPLGEGVVTAPAQVGIGPQELHGVRACGWRRGPLVGKGVRRAVQAPNPVSQTAHRRTRERCRIVPTLPEHGLDVVDGRSVDRHLDVMPRRVRAVLVSEQLGLAVAPVLGVVAPVVGQVDPADEGDVASGVVTVPDDDELLVMRAARAHAHVEEHLGATLLQLLTEVTVLGCKEPSLVQVGAPHQPVYGDASLVRAREHLYDLATRLPGELFVAIALPVCDEHKI